MSLPNRCSPRLYTLREAIWLRRAEETWKAVKRHGWLYFLIGFLLAAALCTGLALAEQASSSLRANIEQARAESVANARLALALILLRDGPHLDLRAESRADLIQQTQRALVLLKSEP